MVLRVVSRNPRFAVGSHGTRASSRKGGHDRPNGSFQVDLAAFEDLKAKFEPLGDDEEREVVDTSGWR